VFTLHNPAAQARHMVVAAPHQRFVASQVLWPRPEGSRVIGLVTAEGRAVAPLPSLGVDAFALTLPPGATASYALEVSTTGLDTLSLWHRGAFHVVADRYAFFRGLVLGISILLGIGFVCLFIVRPQSIFPAAALFGWSAIGFLVIETGYLPTVLAKFPALAGSEQSLRALAEGLMLAGVIAMLASFLDLRRWMPRLAMGLMAGGAAAVALALYGLFDPRTAIGLIRIAFALVVAGGLGVMLVLWRRGAARAQAALLGWLVLTGWTVAAGAGALGLFEPALMHPLVSAGWCWCCSRSPSRWPSSPSASGRHRAPASRRAAGAPWRSPPPTRRCGTGRSTRATSMSAPRSNARWGSRRAHWARTPPAGSSSSTRRTGWPMAPRWRRPSGAAAAASPRSSACGAPTAAIAGMSSGPAPCRVETAAPRASSARSPT
jgi:hypothetical protein